MKGNITLNSNHAVSEVVGGMILILIAVIVFAAIYLYLIPSFEHVDENIKLQGYVTDEGVAVIEHVGGKSISNYRVVARDIDGTLIGSKEHTNLDSPWKISECKYPLEDLGYGPLLDENETIIITIYNLYEDDSEQKIFEGPFKAKTKGPTPTPPTSLPMLLSSLRTNTIDEDLICFNYTISPNINALTYIYNWITNGEPIINLLMSFDTDSLTTVRDYSGNENNGTAYGPNWTSNGVVGGAYEFDGVSDYISLPYCFEDNFIDAITVEAWVKTDSPSGIVSSYNRNRYWELGVVNGKIQWSTNADDGTKDTTSTLTINDGNWHHVATTYDSLMGESAIYIDGEQDIKNSEHNLGELLGTGDTPQGSIGTGPEASRTTVFSTGFETQDEKNKWTEDNETWGGGGGSIKWEAVFYDNFESSYGNWNDGGTDCIRYTGGTHAHQGSCAIDIQDNSGYPTSATYSDNILADSFEYTQMSIDFWWKAASMENGEDFWVNYYDGTNSYRLATIAIGTGQYSNDIFYHTVCYVNETTYPFTDQASFRIQCDASYDDDDIYLDQIYINATTGYRVDYDFNLRDSSALNPRTGSYSIGGTGDFDPEYAYFNRTGLDLSNYRDVILSLWYSYKSTESADKIGLYYKDGANWVTIFEELNPQIGNGNQFPWTRVEIQIPDHIDNLVLQFRWSTSAIDEYMAIDDLEITGVPLGGGYNFSGSIDEFHIYNRALSPEQIYQNYLSTKDGYSDKSVIVSEETLLGDIWKCIVTPNDSTVDDTPVESNTLQIVGYSGGE